MKINWGNVKIMVVPVAVYIYIYLKTLDQIKILSTLRRNLY